MLVKICGLSNIIDAKAAVEAGADALGFVMGGKVIPVEVEPLAQHVRLWIKELPKHVDTYIVTHYTNIDDIIDLSEFVNSSGIQVSESLTPTQLESLRKKTSKKIIKTIPVGGKESLAYLKSVQPFSDYLLLDSTKDGYIGGTGKENNWTLCSELVKAANKPVFVAGGLTPDNVINVLKLTCPQGADISTGVSMYSESYLKKDRKNPEAIKTFIKRAKNGIT